MTNQPIRESRNVEVVHYAGSKPCKESRHIPTEMPIVVNIRHPKNPGITKTLIALCTPQLELEWVYGHLCCDQYITTAQQIECICITHEADQRIVDITLSAYAPVPSDSVDAITSSGERSYLLPKEKAERLQLLHDQTRISPDAIYRAMDELHKRQEIHRLTRGTHAMGLFRQSGQLVAFAEDVGRHNALDKVIGYCLTNADDTAVPPLEELAAVFSSRVSFEMATKCATVGIELIAAIGMPTTMAIDIAEQVNLTICSRVRDNSMTVFTHPRRVIQKQQD